MSIHFIDWGQDKDVYILCTETWHNASDDCTKVYIVLTDDGVYCTRITNEVICEKCLTILREVSAEERKLGVNYARVYSNGRLHWYS